MYIPELDHSPLPSPKRLSAVYVNDLGRLTDYATVDYRLYSLHIV